MVVVSLFLEKLDWVGKGFGWGESLVNSAQFSPTLDVTQKKNVIILKCSFVVLGLRLTNDSNLNFVNYKVGGFHGCNSFV